jgi:hypothetical protein
LAALATAARVGAGAGDEGGRRGGGRGRIGCPGGFTCSIVVNVDLLEQQDGAHLLEGGEQLPHLDVRPHMTELFAEAAQQGEDEGAVADRVTVVGEGRRHRLKAAAKISDGGRTLLGRAELRREQ